MPEAYPAGPPARTRFCDSAYQSYIEKGRCISAARAFVKPMAKRDNLEIRTTAQATAVLFERKRAIGGCYTRGPGHPARDVRALRE